MKYSVGAKNDSMAFSYHQNFEKDFQNFQTFIYLFFIIFFCSLYD